jgi:hypothetical protein
VELAGNNLEDNVADPSIGKDSLKGDPEALAMKERTGEFACQDVQFPCPVCSFWGEFPL